MTKLGVVTCLAQGTLGQGQGCARLCECIFVVALIALDLADQARRLAGE
jgi:hypothetical protein